MCRLYQLYDRANLSGIAFVSFYAQFKKFWYYQVWQKRFCGLFCQCVVR